MHLFLANEYQLVTFYSIALGVICLLLIGGGIVYSVYLRPKMQLKTTDIEVIEPIGKPKAWLGIGIYFVCFYIVAFIIQVVALSIYLARHSISIDQISETSTDYLTLINICNFLTYIVTLVALLPIFIKEVRKDLNLVKGEKNFYLGWWGKGVLIMYGLIFLSNILIQFFTFGLETNNVSENEETINLIMNSGVGNLLLMGIVTVILAPIIEEVIFRKCLFGIFKKNNVLTIIFSALIFASIHVVPACLTIIGSMANGEATFVDLYLEFICIISYLGQAFAISFVYYKTKQNVIPCMLIHFTNNFIAFIATIALQFLPQLG